MKTQIEHIVIFLFFIFNAFYIIKGYKNKVGSECEFISCRDFKMLNYVITEPWKTKYHWAGIVQVTLLLQVIIIQLI